MKYFISSIIILAIISCEKNVEVKVPSEPSKIVISGLVQANNLYKVAIGKSVPILAPLNSNTYIVNNAFVQLLENNVVKDTLVYNPSSNLYIAKNNTRALTGNNYQIKASVPGMAQVDASTLVPVPVAIQNITRRENVRTNSDNISYDEIRFSIADNSSLENFYLVKIKKPIGFTGNAVQYQAMDCIKSTDRDIDRSDGTDPTDFNSCFEQEFFMNDKNFNGNLKEIVIFIAHRDMVPLVNSTNGKKYMPVIELYSLTQDHYKYRKSYDKYLDAEDNPFAEPVLVYSNVNNGFGIFSGFNLVRDTIR